MDCLRYLFPAFQAFRPRLDHLGNLDYVRTRSFPNSQNENYMNYKTPHRMKFLVFGLRLALCWLSLNYVNKSGAF